MATITSTWETHTIERIDASDFTLDRLRQRTPAIVVGALAGWKAVEKWSPEYLASVLSDREVRVAVSKDHRYNYAAAKTAFEPLTRFDKQLMPFAQFVTKLQHAKAAGEHYYLMQRPIEEEFPELVPDIQRPSWVADRQLDMNLWVGSEGNVTQMHFDRDENFLAEVRGRKHLRLFDPSQTEFLYPYPKDSVMYYLSFVDCDNPDFDTYPEFRNARPWEGELHPGELLYLPARWWHQVRSLDDAISVNFWWRPDPNQV
jgi:ribosomal protein L16 Arg81 hydroxylase